MNTPETLPQLDARIPHWPLDQLEERPCPLCGQSHQVVLLRPDHLPVAYCDTCSLWYIRRLPPEAVITQFYSRYWRHSRPNDMSEATAEQMIDYVRQGKVRDVRVSRLEALVGGLKGRRLLEVGCGLGSFLLAAQARGAEVMGQDISPDACRFVREHLGIWVSDDPLQASAIAIGQVDIVVMNDLIEHPIKPLELLEMIYPLLVPGGLLLIWTPNGGAAGDALETARTWVGFRVDLEHLQYFSTRTIIWLANQQGWYIEHLETLGHPILNGIDRLPVVPSAPKWPRLRQWIKHLPGSQRLLQAIRAFASEIAGDDLPSVRNGTYHLFAILKKR